MLAFILIIQAALIFAVESAALGTAAFEWLPTAAAFLTSNATKRTDRTAHVQSNTFHRFMDLPPEVRMVVYGHLARTIYEYRIPIDDHGETNAAIILILRTVELGILMLCRTIHHEANRVMQGIIERFISEKLPQLAGTQHENSFISLEIIMGAAELEADRLRTRERFLQLGYVRGLYWDGVYMTPIMVELRNIWDQMRSWKRPAFSRVMDRFEMDMPMIVRWVKQAGRQLHYHHRIQLRLTSIPSSLLEGGHFRYITVFSCKACYLLNMNEQARENAHIEALPSSKALSFFDSMPLVFQLRVLRRARFVEIQGHVYDPTGRKRLKELMYEHWELPDQDSHEDWLSQRGRAVITTQMGTNAWEEDWEPSKSMNASVDGV
jgi:hypothetical protein